MINVYDQSSPAEFELLNTRVPIPYEALGALGAQVQRKADITRAGADELENLLAGSNYSRWDLAQGSPQAFQKQLEGDVQSYMDKHGNFLSSPEAQKDFLGLERKYKGHPALQAFKQGYELEQAYDKQMLEAKEKGKQDYNWAEQDMELESYLSRGKDPSGITGTFRRSPTGEFDFSNPEYFNLKGYTPYADVRKGMEEYVNDKLSSGAYGENVNGAWQVKSGGEGRAYNDIASTVFTFDDKGQIAGVHPGAFSTFIQSDSGANFINQLSKRTGLNKGQLLGTKEGLAMVQGEYIQEMDSAIRERTHWTSKQELTANPIWMQERRFQQEKEMQQIPYLEGKTLSLPTKAFIPQTPQENRTKISELKSQLSQYEKQLVNTTDPAEKQFINNNIATINRDIQVAEDRMDRSVISKLTPEEVQFYKANKDTITKDKQLYEEDYNNWRLNGAFRKATGSDAGMYSKIANKIYNDKDLETNWMNGLDKSTTMDLVSIDNTNDQKMSKAVNNFVASSAADTQYLVEDSEGNITPITDLGQQAAFERMQRDGEFNVNGLTKVPNGNGEFIFGSSIPEDVEFLGIKKQGIKKVYLQIPGQNVSEVLSDNMLSMYPPGTKWGDIGLRMRSPEYAIDIQKMKAGDTNYPILGMDKLGSKIPIGLVDYSKTPSGNRYVLKNPSNLAQQKVYYSQEELHNALIQLQESIKK